MELNCLIVDIDNTIADPSERLERSLADLGRREVYEKTSDKFGGFEEYLSSEELDEFWRLFLSGKYLQHDQPAPGAADFLNKVNSKGVELFYLTGRHDDSGDSMRPGTVEWLNSHGFPVPNQAGVELFMKPHRYDNDREYKRSLLSELLTSGSDCRNPVGIGDHPNDAAVYELTGVMPVLLEWLGLFPREELRAAGSEVLVLENWEEIEMKFSGKLKAKH